MENTDLLINSLRQIEGLDVEQGILYCGGEDSYIEILHTYCEDWESGVETADDLFEKKDWKNYTITVHGLKSALFSIGINHLSEMAKQLEYAGKENRTDFIMENHNGFVEMYKIFFANLVTKIGLSDETKEVVEQAEEMKEISSGQFNKILSDMEEAVYSFDNAVMLKYVEELEQYRYNGHVLQTVLVPVRRKIEMSDLFSAVEMIVNQKKEMDE